MKLTTIWNAWREAEHQYNLATDNWHRCISFDSPVARGYKKLVNRRERQMYKFVDAIMDHIAAWDKKHEQQR